MTSFTELAERLAELAEDADNDFTGLNEAELSQTLGAMFTASCASAAALVERLNGNIDAARAEISRALELPAPVLRRRYGELVRALGSDEVPNVPQHAAHIAVLTHECRRITARVDFLRSGGRLN